MFEWDEVKRQANLAKHGIDFADVLGVFTDPARIELVDARRDYGEPRWVTVAPVQGRMLHVTWTWRAGNRRLISARKANAREQRRYEQIRREA
jgi:uncharacterized DUF497 family protein